MTGGGVGPHPPLAPLTPFVLSEVEGRSRAQVLRLRSARTEGDRSGLACALDRAARQPLADHVELIEGRVTERQCAPGLGMRDAHLKPQ